MQLDRATHWISIPLLTLVAASPACVSTDRHDDVVAHYDGGVVRRDEYRDWLASQHVADDPDVRRDLVSSLVTRRTLADAARRHGLDRDPAVRASLLMGEAEILETALRKAEADAIEIPPAILAEAVARHRESFGVPRRVQLRNIFLRFPAGADDAERTATRARLEAIRAELEAGADFAALAGRESDSQSRFNGGKMAVVRPGELAPAIDRIAFALAPGELSEILETPDGVTLLRCDRVLPARRPDDAVIPDKVLEKLRKEALADRLAALRRRLTGTVEIDSAGLAAAADPATVVLRTADGTTLDHDGARMAIRRLAGDDDVDQPEGARRRLDEVAWLLAAAEEARRRGLDRRTDTRIALERFAQDTLGTEELRRRIMARFVPIGEDEMRQLYATEGTSLTREAQYHLQVIRMRATRDQVPRRLRRLDALASEIAAGRVSFEAAARSTSDHPSAADGGLLPWCGRSAVATLGPTVLKVVDSLADGGTSPAVQQADGLTGDSTLWIIRRLGHQPRRPLTFDEARRTLENRLGNRQVQRLTDAILGEIAAGMHLELVPAAFDGDTGSMAAAPSQPE